MDPDGGLVLSGLGAEQLLTPPVFLLQLLITGTEQFNQKPKKGIQFLQEKGLLTIPMDNTEVAQWLRENPRLDKKMIGEFVSDRKNIDLLENFVR